MAATMATMAILNTKCFNMMNKTPNPSKPTTRPISGLLSLQNLPKGLKVKLTSDDKVVKSNLLSSSMIAGALFSTLSSCDAAFAAQQIAELAEGDNRGLALLLPIIPAIAWVLFNILQPALNQISRMRTEKAVMIGLGMGGLAASGFMFTPHALAAEASTTTSDSRGQLLLIVITPAILWVLYNILQPALNQLNKMRSQ